MTAPLKLPTKLAREWLAMDGLGLVADVHHWLRGQLEAAKRKALKKRPAKAEKRAKRETQRERWLWTRAAVLVRADGHCECCGRQVQRLEVDHFFGGSGRRKALQSLFTCWALAPSCHLAKTLNAPSATRWLNLFREHCDRQVHRSTSAAEAAGYRDAEHMACKRIAALQDVAGLPHGRRTP